MCKQKEMEPIKFRSVRPNKNKTRIHDLPEECLAHVLSRVGSPSLPLRGLTGALPETNRVKHLLQCAFVCRHWRKVAATAVHALSFHVNIAALSEEQARNVAARITNLATLTLTKRVTRLPLESGPLEGLAGLEILSPRLQSLEIMFPITTVILPAIVGILVACRSLRSLRMALIQQDGLLSEDEALDLFNVVRTLPLLATLTLELYHTRSAAVWELVSAMETLTDVRLQCDSIPPILTSGGRLAGTVRSLVCNKVEQESDLGALTHLTAIESLELQNGADSIVALPECLGRLSGLQRLTLHKMRGLRSLASAEAIGRLSGTLQELSVTDCEAFGTLPDAIGSLRQLRTLKVDRCGGPVPETLTCLTNLRVLHLKGGGDVGPKTLPEGIGQLPCLQSLCLVSLPLLGSLPDSLGRLAGLTELEISGCPIASLPARVCALARLKLCTLALPEVEALPESLGEEGGGGWRALESLIVECPKISRLPDGVGRLDKLQVLSLRGCHLLHALPGAIVRLSALAYVRVRDCPLLMDMPASLGCLLDSDVVGDRLSGPSAVGA